MLQALNVCYASGDFSTDTPGFENQTLQWLKKVQLYYLVIWLYLTLDMVFENGVCRVLSRLDSLVNMNAKKTAKAGIISELIKRKMP